MTREQRKWFESRFILLAMKKGRHPHEIKKELDVFSDEQLEAATPTGINRFVRPAEALSQMADEAELYLRYEMDKEASPE